MKTLSLMLLSLLAQLSNAQVKSPPTLSKDIDPNIAPVVIGSQVWMRKNLDVNTFANGDTIMQAESSREWRRAIEEQKPAWCHYDSDPSTGEKYGKLYNWYAVIDPRGLAPKGWHIPTDKEWSILIDTLGGKEKAGAKLKSDFGWGSSNDRTGNGNNESGFTALPGGYRKGYDIYSKAEFSGLGFMGYWWSSTEIVNWVHSPKNGNRFPDNPVTTLLLSYNSNLIGRIVNSKDIGLSVRCLLGEGK